MAKTLSNDELRRLARLGAAARLRELDEERRAILRAFPGVAAQAGRQDGADGARVAEPAGEAPKKRKRRPMTAAQKRAASERMIKYWAEKKQG